MNIEIKNKYCPECGIYRRIDEFKKLHTESALRKNPDGYYWCCNLCWKEKTWVFSPENAPSMNRKMRRRLKSQRRIVAIEATYGLSEEQYRAKIAEQSNLCAICGNKDKSRVLCVDHDHKTGAIRGLLCNNCNIGLGNLKDNIQILQSAIAYLYKYSKWPGPPEKDKVPGIKAPEKVIIN